VRHVNKTMCSFTVEYFRIVSRHGVRTSTRSGSASLSTIAEAGDGKLSVEVSRTLSEKLTLPSKPKIETDSAQVRSAKQSVQHLGAGCQVLRIGGLLGAVELELGAVQSP
jgi:hypothetical protein